VPYGPLKNDEIKLKRFKRKILKTIHGPILNIEAQRWETRSNNQINEHYKKENMV